jgi:hypothetical protein
MLELLQAQTSAATRTTASRGSAAPGRDNFKLRLLGMGRL